MYQGAMKWKITAVLAAVLGLGALSEPSQAAIYNLRADVVVKTMPDGRLVRMWGLACDSAAEGGVCPNPGIVTAPGPELTVDPATPSLTINLTNNLPEPISLVIPGQTATMTPVFFTPPPPPPPAPAFLPRVRSLTHETPAGGSATYDWPAFAPGTFLYHSGSHLAVQVPMGLYGAVRMDSAAGFAYPGVDFAAQATFLFSEVDPALNDAVAGDPVTGALPIYGTAAFPSSIHFTPRYFLVNGEPFPSGLTHTYVGPPASRVLLRFLNAGLAVRSPVIVDAHVQLVAEDGNLYPDEKTQYSLDLAAGKTMDAIGTFADGYYPIFDRRLGLTNGDASTGGMFAYLEVGPDHTAGGQAMLNVNKVGQPADLVVSNSLPGGINCGLTCSQHYLPGTELRLKAEAGPGSVFFAWTGCNQVVNVNECVVALPTDVVTTPAVTVTATFIAAIGRIGAFRSATWYLDKGPDGWQNPSIDAVFPAFGLPTDIPVSADVNGDGFSEIGTFRDGRWFFDLDNDGAWGGCPINGGTDLCLSSFGTAGDIPITGDWNGDGTDEVGVFRQGKWYFDMDGSGTYDVNVDTLRQNFGLATDRPVTGDWNGDGRTEIGVFRAGNWFIDYNGNGGWNGVAGGDKIYVFGAATDLPVTLDWNADGKSEVGVFRPATGTWYLDNGNGAWDLGIDHVIAGFGAPTDTPVTGVWR